MISSTSACRSARRYITAAGILSSIVCLSTITATAGECPTNQLVADGRGQKMGPTNPKDVTDTVLKRIDLVNEPVMLKDHALRLRRLVVKPGGIVPWHSHDDRPAIIYVAEGEIVEYASNCADPIVHKAGDIRPETHGTSHWWQNLGNKTVVLFVGDVLHDKNDKNM